MSWRDRFLDASFKDVPFYLDSHDTSITRQIVVHSFPGSESHYSQDMGREPGGFQITAYIIGIDYDLERDRFMAACQSPGPGELVHPHLGVRLVHLRSVQVRESRSELQIARFEMILIEAGENFFPAPEVRKKAAVLNAAAGARSEAQVSFLQSFSLEGGLDLIRSSAAYIDAQVGRFRALERQVGQIYAFDATLTVATQSAAELLAAPKNLATTFTEAMGRITGKSGNLYAVEALRNLGREYGLKIPRGQSADRSPTGSMNFLLFKETILTRTEALAEILEAAENPENITPESSYRAALQDVATDIERTLSVLSSFVEYQSFSDLKTVLLTLSESADVYALPDLKKWTVPYDMPLSIAAFKIFGSTDRAGDLQKLNEIIDPILIPKGKILSYING